MTQTYGAGKVLFMGTDGAWRWRKGVEDKYHYRFWGQVVRWMAYQRHMAKGESMRLYYSPEQPQMHQTVMLNANVMERSGEPLAKGDVIARIIAPSGKAETIRMNAQGDEWGAYSGRYTAAEPGNHVAGPDIHPQPFSYLPQQLIAHQMAGTERRAVTRKPLYMAPMMFLPPPRRTK